MSTDGMDDDDSLAISGLQHLAFCPRQWGLIHLEQAWADNRQTAEGTLLHERADLPGESQRDHVKTVRAMWLRSARMRLFGRADLVEFQPEPFPVEYKRGKGKPDNRDSVQLCAQALCLEEMLNVEVSRGAIFYGLPRRRQEVDFTSALRNETQILAETMHRLYRERSTPKAEFSDKCRACSLVHLCLPSVGEKNGSVVAWLGRQMIVSMKEW